MASAYGSPSLKKRKTWDEGHAHRYQAIQRALNNVDEHKLSDPTCVIPIPFPMGSSHFPADRFELSEQQTFAYLGRQQFLALERRASGLGTDRENWRKRLDVYGTKGYGKSHMLAALACFLMKRRRVVYIANCAQLAEHSPWRYVAQALRLTFGDKTETQMTISEFKDASGVIDFCRAQENLLFIVDQYKSVKPGGRVAEPLRSEATKLLSDCIGEHPEVRGYSANNDVIRDTESKQSSPARLTLFGGYSEVSCMLRNCFVCTVFAHGESVLQAERKGWTAWRSSICSSMTPIQLERLWTATGCVPLLLHEYVKVHQQMHGDNRVTSYASAWGAFMQQEGYKVFQQLKEFVMDGTELDQRERLCGFSQFLTRSPPTTTVKNQDHRWFFVANDMDPVLYKSGCGYPLCGLVQQNAAMFLHEKSQFNHGLWLKACRECDNPSVQGFLAEQLVIHAVHKNGFDLQFSGKKTTFKPQQQDIVIFQTGNEHLAVRMDSLSYLYSPHAFNYNYIDLLVNQHVKRNGIETVVLAAFQVTFKTIAAHKDSLDFFSSSCRQGWEKGYRDKPVEWHFVWVVKEDEAIRKGNEYPKQDSCRRHMVPPP
jgi:hypothetical protein